MNAPTVAGVLAVKLDGIPHSMRSAPRWGLWRYKSRGGKPTKLPFSVVRCADARANHPEDWSSFDVVAAYFLRKRQHDGLGFLLGDGWGGVDLDKCRDPESGALEPWAAHIVARLGSYTEISPSGTGLKVFIRGATEGSGRRRKGFSSYDGGTLGEMEVYTRLRYFTVTGDRHVG